MDYKKRNAGFYPSAINVVTHSMGGLIVRQAIGQNGKLTFRDDNGQTFQVKINRVVMLAPPNAGSYLSDAIRDPIGLQNWVSAVELKGVLIPVLNKWLVDNAIPKPSWKSTKNLQTSTIRHFSESQAWPDSINLQLMAATAGSATAGPLRFGSNWILARLRDVNLDQSPEAVNDGAVTRPSVDGQYYEKKGTSDTLLAFSKRSTIRKMNGDSVPSSATDMEVGGRALDHFSILTDTAIIDAVASVLDGRSWPHATQSSSVRISSALAAAPSGPLQSVESHTGSVPSAGVAQFSVVSDAASKLSVQLLTDSNGVLLKLQNPSGNIIDSTTSLTNPSVQYTAAVSGDSILMASYAISNPAPGRWKVIVDGAAVSESQTDYLVTASVDSYVTLLPQTGPLFDQGQNIVVRCALADLGGNPAVPVANAAITATVQLPDRTTTTLNLADDGLHNDGAPNDGVYAAVLPAAAQAGEYMLTYRASGTNSQGQEFQRVASGAVSVSSANANLLGDPFFATIDTDGDGVADSLQAKCGVNPKAAGNYILSGQIVDSGGTLRIPASAQFHTDRSGPMTVSLFFDLSLAKAAGLSGAFHIENLQLFEVPSGGTAWLDTYQGTAVTQISFGPSITTQPQNLTTISGSEASFTVAATGSGALTYQWQLSTNGGSTWTDLGNTGTYSGVNTTTLTVNGLTGAMNGYQFQAPTRRSRNQARGELMGL